MLASVMGGGAAQGLWTDHVIQIAMIPAVFIGFSGMARNHLGLGANALALGLLLLMALQFLPYAPPRETINPPATFSILELWTLSPSRSLQSVAFLGAVLGFALFIARFEQASQRRLLRFFFLGLAINIAIAVIQLSFSGGTRISDVFPFVITSALFANENHFSSLVFASIPLIAWQLVSNANRLIAFILVTGLIVAILFAVGSRAGMAISAGLAFLSLLWFLLPIGRIAYHLLLLGLAAILVVLIIPVLDIGLALGADLRSTFFVNTLAAIHDAWLYGTGLGTFPIVYPRYESADEVIRVYANHAHNDYLEIFLETGLLGLLLLASYLVLLARSLFGTPLSQAAGLSLLAIMVHSTVDYPLRTMAIASLFAALSAIAFTRLRDK